MDSKEESNNPQLLTHVNRTIEMRDYMLDRVPGAMDRWSVFPEGGVDFVYSNPSLRVPRHGPNLVPCGIDAIEEIAADEVFTFSRQGLSNRLQNTATSSSGLSAPATSFRKTTKKLKKQSSERKQAVEASKPRRRKKKPKSKQKKMKSQRKEFFRPYSPYETSTMKSQKHNFFRPYTPYEKSTMKGPPAQGRSRKRSHEAPNPFETPSRKRARENPYTSAKRHHMYANDY